MGKESGSMPAESPFERILVDWQQRMSVKWEGSDAELKVLTELIDTKALTQGSVSELIEMFGENRDETQKHHDH